MSGLADLRAGEPTLMSTWEAIAGVPVTDELLEWPPDVFALTNVLSRSVRTPRAGSARYRSRPAPTASS